MNDRSLYEFILLGQRLYILENPINASVVTTEIGNFLLSLEICGLERSRVAAQPLANITGIGYEVRTGATTQAAFNELRAYLAPIHNTIRAELGEQRAILVNVGIVSQELRQLPSRIGHVQSDLLNETIICIECGAYRSGVVMGWNLVYDFIRQWVFDNHLAAFNKELMTRYLRKDKSTPVFDSIITYDDFYTGKPDERTVIDTCHFANLFGDKVADNLRFYLRRRNNYAHPTFSAPSADQTNGYLKDLLDTIKGPPFL